MTCHCHGDVGAVLKGFPVAFLRFRIRGQLTWAIPKVDYSSQHGKGGLLNNCAQSPNSCLEMLDAKTRWHLYIVSYLLAELSTDSVGLFLLPCTRSMTGVAASSFTNWNVSLDANGWRQSLWWRDINLPPLQNHARSFFWVRAGDSMRSTSVIQDDHQNTIQIFGERKVIKLHYLFIPVISLSKIMDVARLWVTSEKGFL